ncbi:MAG: UvrB/UvrC motif-containing protein [candidate division KSB1 bacterium]|nr:UvrB/UvrC motif-containing protein [candidate division KSB1 bacterium]
MSEDISHILRNWPFDEQDLNVRYIKGDDGTIKLQMRLDLGILQMELDGRPDGRRPHNADSYFEYFESQAKMLSNAGHPKMFHLSVEDCVKLQLEAVQYYHRYLALMKLRDFPRVVRDTSRNLRLFTFIERYCDNEEIVWQFIQHRPYVIMINSRARAMLEIEHGDYQMALDIIHDGILGIREFNEKWSDRVGPDFPELEFLESWYKEISELRPLSEKERLMQELERAVSIEDYERAAILRDKLAALNKLLKF